MTVEKDKADAFCADKQFGTFFFVPLTISGETRTELYYCASASKAEWFIFGSSYAYAVVTRLAGKVEVFALTAGASSHDFRCRAEQTVSNREPLPLNENLCNGHSVAALSPTPVVVRGGHAVAMIPIRAAPAAPASACDRMRDECCVNEPPGDARDGCLDVARTSTDAVCTNFMKTGSFRCE